MPPDYDLVLRDLLAAFAMHAILGNDLASGDGQSDERDVAALAYEQADAMLVARANRGGGSVSR